MPNNSDPARLAFATLLATLDQRIGALETYVRAHLPLVTSVLGSGTVYNAGASMTPIADALITKTFRGGSALIIYEIDVYYTGSTAAEVTASQIANVNHPTHPEFQDFGDMMLHGNGGAGYVRVDWFTPDGLGVWGDGRLFILGTEGYIELRKYIDVAGRPGANHLFIVDRKQARYMDCSKVALPFGPQFVADIVNRTHIAQDQRQALLAAELVLKAQKNAKVLAFTT